MKKFIEFLLENDFDFGPSKYSTPFDDDILYKGRNRRPRYKVDPVTGHVRWIGVSDSDRWIPKASQNFLTPNADIKFNITSDELSRDSFFKIFARKRKNEPFQFIKDDNKENYSVEIIYKKPIDRLNDTRIAMMSPYNVGSQIIVKIFDGNELVFEVAGLSIKSMIVPGIKWEIVKTSPGWPDKVFKRTTLKEFNDYHIKNSKIFKTLNDRINASLSAYREKLIKQDPVKYKRFIKDLQPGSSLSHIALADKFGMFDDDE